MKLLLRKLLIGSLLLGGIGVAPIIPAGNGVVSYAVFKDHATGSLFYKQIPDSQYKDMGGKDGIKQNPTGTSSDGVAVPMLYSVQYPTKDQTDILASYKASATSTVEVPPLDKFSDNDTVSVFNFVESELIPTASAAIAFDTTSTGHVTATSLTFSHTMSATAGGYLVCGVAPGDNVDNITGVTYNAVSMTQYELTSGGSHQYGFGLANPSTGANNVVISRSLSGDIRAVCSSYTGALGGIDNHGQTIQSGTQTSLTVTATSIVDNSWAVLLFGWQRNPSASTGLTNRRASDDSAYHVGDSNGVIHPAGTYNMTYTFASCGDQCMSGVWLTLSPTVAATPSNPQQDAIFLEDE